MIILSIIRILSILSIRIIWSILNSLIIVDNSIPITSN